VGPRDLAPTDRRVHLPLDVMSVFGSAGTDRRAEAARNGPIEGLP
jgi:hypothetical protein